MHLDVSGSSAALYRRLRSRQPAPYGAFLHTESNRRILSFSPELFFRVERDGAARRITTRPMKGTAPRGRTTGEDRALADGLSNDPKNRSENVMIVDLLRNDLGRLCAFGSVRASRLFAVEREGTDGNVEDGLLLRKEADSSGVDASRTLLKLRNKLHGPNLGCAGDGAAGKQGAENILKADLRT